MQNARLLRQQESTLIVTLYFLSYGASSRDTQNLMLQQKKSLGTEEKRGITFRSSTDEIFETLTGNNKIR